MWLQHKAEKNVFRELTISCCSCLVYGDKDTMAAKHMAKVVASVSPL
jgi:hypothetical protein